MKALIARLGISAACYRAWRDGRWWGFLMLVIDFLSRDKLHCWRANQNQQRRKVAR